MAIEREKERNRWQRRWEQEDE